MSVRIIEDCLNGRRTVLDDPVKSGRNGLIGLEQRIEVNSPLAVAIIMLGVNDFQSGHNFTASDTARGLTKLVAAIRRAPIEPGMPVPRVLLIAPPPLQASIGPLASKFIDAEAKSAGLAEARRDVAQEVRCEFFDAGLVTSTSAVDGVHLDESQHRALGIALAHVVAQQFANASIPERTFYGDL
ncbi:MAG: SGNH/GDSL hydrolase family protein [Pirellulaceae bacterium]